MTIKYLEKFTVNSAQHSLLLLTIINEVSITMRLQDLMDVVYPASVSHLTLSSPHQWKSFDHISTACLRHHIQRRILGNTFINTCNTFPTC